MIWLLARMLYVIVLLVGVHVIPFVPQHEGVAGALHPAPAVRLVLVALTVVLLHIDRRRAHETLLQSNFGVSPLWFAATSLLAAGGADIVVHALLRAIVAP